MSQFVNRLITRLQEYMDGYDAATSLQTRAALERIAAETLEAARVHGVVWTIAGTTPDREHLVPVAFSVLGEEEVAPGQYTLQVYGDNKSAWFTLPIGPCVFPSEAAAAQHIEVMQRSGIRKRLRNAVVDVLLDADREDLGELLDELIQGRIPRTRQRANPTAEEQ